MKKENLFNLSELAEMIVMNLQDIIYILENIGEYNSEKNEFSIQAIAEERSKCVKIEEQNRYSTLITEKGLKYYIQLLRDYKFNDSNHSKKDSYYCMNPSLLDLLTLEDLLKKYEKLNLSEKILDILNQQNLIEKRGNHLDFSIKVLHEGLGTTRRYRNIYNIVLSEDGQKKLNTIINGMLVIEK